jgi:tRNA dimethylallyltransferase
MSALASRTLHVITGPTAVGKTELSLRWAEENDAEIVSCDSLLFYRGMDIGTAKPSPVELARVPHHLIDICAVSERMDITRYVRLARRAIDEISSRGRRVLVVGGSGFYLRSFFAPVADSIHVPAELRLELETRLAEHGLQSLVQELLALNPGSMGTLDTSNPRRVLRALERCRASGRTLADLSAEFARQPGPFADWKVCLTCLDRPREELEKRIEQRVAGMLAAGLIAETKRLLDEGLKENPSAAKAIGYRETIEVIEGRQPSEKLAEVIIANTRALVKKQRTWFRTQLRKDEGGTEG